MSFDASATRYLAWIGAAATALIVYRRQTHQGETRFDLALLVGAFCAHLGWALVHLPRALSFPDWILQPGAASVIFFPLGVLLVAPWREALAALPLALAAARLGCLPFDCCYSEPLHALPELTGLVLLHAMARRWPEQMATVVLSGFGALRLISLPFRAPEDPEPFLDPAWIAMCWMVAGPLLGRRIGAAANAREWIDERNQPLLRGLALMLFTWLLISLAAHVAPTSDLAPAGASLVATTAVLATCRAQVRAVLRARPLALVFLGGLVGFATGSMWNPSFDSAGLTTARAATVVPLSPAFALSVVIVAPIFEELLYRGRLLGDLRRLWGPLPALVISSALFALAHFHLQAMPIAFLGGIVTAALVLRTRSLGLAIGLHAGWNLAAVAA